jgi:hypothetical protein
MDPRVASKLRLRLGRGGRQGEEEQISKSGGRNHDRFSKAQPVPSQPKPFGAGINPAPPRL